MKLKFIISFLILLNKLKFKTKNIYHFFVLVFASFFLIF